MRPGLEAALERGRTYIILGKPWGGFDGNMVNLNVTIQDPSQWIVRIDDEIGANADEPNDHE